MISVIIPVKNGAGTLERCLKSLRNQTIGKDLEIIILDSMSTDNSKEIGFNYGANIISIPDGTFNHGLTRNLGVQNSSGDLIYLTVQDAWLSSDDMLLKMSVNFSDINLIAVAGMQGIPHSLNTNPAIWFKRITEPMQRIVHFQKKEFEKLSPSQQYEYSAWDDVNAMYRKSALVEIPFIKTDYAEDWLWARDALCKGFKLMHDPSVLVYHYHHMYFKYIFKEKYIIATQFYNSYSVKPKFPSFINVLRRLYRVCKTKDISIGKKMYWSLHNILQFSGHFLSVFLFRSIIATQHKHLIKKIYSMISGVPLMGAAKK